MFAYLKGTLTCATPTQAIVEVHGIGYLVNLPTRIFGQLPQLGQAVQLFTAFILRENSQALYGFLTSQERDFFEILLNVSGIGPKMALALLGHLSLHDLQSAILQHDLPLLVKVPGVGKKTAERLVMEMKDKVFDLAPEISHATLTLQSDSDAQKVQDAMMAMVNLGYTQGTAQKAIKLSLQELPKEIDLGELITLALKKV